MGCISRLVSKSQLIELLSQLHNSVTLSSVPTVGSNHSQPTTTVTVVRSPNSASISRTSSSPWPLVTQLRLPSPSAGLILTPSPKPLAASEYELAYARLLRDHPHYLSSWHVDDLRRSEYSRFAPNDTYVDYMGYPSSLASVHANFLPTAVLGNPHSENPKSGFALSLSHHVPTRL